VELMSLVPLFEAFEIGFLCLCGPEDPAAVVPRARRRNWL
jgi:hypothetical protein